MALVKSTLLNQFQTNNQATFTTVNNSLCLVFLTTHGATSNNASNLSISGGGLTWTPAVTVGNFTDTSFPVCIRAFVAQVTTGASVTITISGDPNNDSAVDVYSFTGYNTSTPTGATATSTTTADAQSLTLSGAPASSSIVMSLSQSINNNGTGTTPWVTAGAGWSLDTGRNSAGAGWFNIGVENRTASTSTSVAWADIAFADTPYKDGVAALEILAAAGGAASLTPYRRPLRSYQRRF